MIFQRKFSGAEVRAYWSECIDLYLEHMTTFQAGLFASPNAQNPFFENARNIVERSGIVDGECVLDLGCGVCGPVIEMAKILPSSTFVSVTDCNRQVAIARELVAEQGLSDQISVICSDYHDLQVLSGEFDHALFLESFGYTRNPKTLLREVASKLKPEGYLYIKDVCKRWNLSENEQAELQTFNETFCYNTPTLASVRNATNGAGFSSINASLVTSIMYREHSKRSMFDLDDAETLTEFGKRHFKGYSNLPIDFYELRAFKPKQA